MVTVVMRWRRRCAVPPPDQRLDAVAAGLHQPRQVEVIPFTEPAFVEDLVVEALSIEAIAAPPIAPEQPDAHRRDNAPTVLCLPQCCGSCGQGDPVSDRL